MVERFANGGSATGLASRRRRSRASDELMQLKQLSSRDDEPVRSSPKPLFVVEGADEFLATSDHAPKESSKPVPRTRAVSVPTFAQVHYTDEDFLKLLDNDEPYIPASRYRKRRPSSTLSIKERNQGQTEDKTAPEVVKEAVAKPARTTKAKSRADNVAGSKATKPRKTKAVKETATPSQEKSDAPAKPRRRKKSNAKPRAED